MIQLLNNFSEVVGINDFFFEIFKLFYITFYIRYIKKLKMFFFNSNVSVKELAFIFISLKRDFNKNLHL